MLQKKFENSKYLVVVFPGGAGGNHIQNMISLSPLFNDLFSSVNYTDSLLENYNNIRNKFMDWGIKVHFNNQPNLQGLQNQEYKTHIKQSNLKTTLIGHNHCFQDAIQNNFFVDFEDCVWLIVTWPQTEDSLVYKRIRKGNYWPQFTENYKFPYLVPSTFHYYIDSTKGCLLDPIKLFTVNGSHYLRKVLVENFGFELPKEADTLHKIWYNLQTQF